MSEHNERSYGFDDPELFNVKATPFGAKKWISLILAILFLIGVWFALDQKLLLGEDWLSATYDNPDWRTNEGNLHTYGAWDLEAHIWKTEYIMENYPNYDWNPYWYLGMPLVKYYPSGFYLIQSAVISLTQFTAAKSALMLIIFGHLVATLLTFLVCYKVSKRIWVSALSASFVLTNTFLSLRSYGWEPITVVFLFLFPLGLYLFFKEPLKPLRFWLIILLGVAYISHPLLWFSLCMTFGIYLFSIAIRKSTSREVQTRHFIFHFVVLVLLSLLIGAVQFLPQFTYQQVTSGAHMGISYLPFYQVAPNIITLKDFFFDAGNLKGPGPILMIAFLLLAAFAYLQYVRKSRKEIISKEANTTLGQESFLQRSVKKLHQHELITGLALTLFVMVLFYYLELYNIFPMNVLRSIQYHRIIPEFVIVAAVLVAALSNMIRTPKQKIMYYSVLIAFVCASSILVYSVQSHWKTSSEIGGSPEFIIEEFEGRISFPYTDQSLAVRNSFTHIPQTYGYYEQGVTNPYADEMFSVSSGYHNANLTILYLKAANVARLYVNMEEGERDTIVRSRLDGIVPFYHDAGNRYAYFAIPLTNPSMVQAVDKNAADRVVALEPGCRVMFSEEYCGSVREEFVSTDINENKYFASYVALSDAPYAPKATLKITNPNEYIITLNNATYSTAVIVKMTYDKNFKASINVPNGEEVPITSIGPYYMLISPNRAGSYSIKLEYGHDPILLAGTIISAFSFAIVAAYFLYLRLISSSLNRKRPRSRLSAESHFSSLPPKKGDM